MVYSLIAGIDFKIFEKTISRYFDDLGNFHFSLFNPFFWVFLVILFFILSRPWGYKKSFSFCLIIAIALLGTTVLENMMADTLAKSELFDFSVVKIVSLFIISMITLYYLFIKSD